MEDAVRSRKGGANRTAMRRRDADCSVAYLPLASLEFPNHSPLVFASDQADAKRLWLCWARLDAMSAYPLATSLNRRNAVI